MDDLISRQAAIQAIDDLPNCYNGYSDTYDKAYIIGVLEELPSVQPEIIRCKDCVFAQGHFTNAPVKCGCGYGTHGEEYFCADGKRRK